MSGLGSENGLAKFFIECLAKKFWISLLPQDYLSLIYRAHFGEGLILPQAAIKEEGSVLFAFINKRKMDIADQRVQISSPYARKGSGKMI
jgi:hypothetical protein